MWLANQEARSTGQGHDTPKPREAPQTRTSKACSPGIVEVKSDKVARPIKWVDLGSRAFVVT